MIDESGFENVQECVEYVMGLPLQILRDALEGASICRRDGLHVDERVEDLVTTMLAFREEQESAGAS